MSWPAGELARGRVDPRRAELTRGRALHDPRGGVSELTRGHALTRGELTRGFPDRCAAQGPQDGDYWVVRVRHIYSKGWCLGNHRIEKIHTVLFRFISLSLSEIRVGEAAS